jgi:mannose-6-phosphate isomerase-like protein (cupin superfamily)
MMDYTLVNRDDLPHDANTWDFEGAQYPNTNVSFIWVDMEPGHVVKLHQHPYEEIFIIQEGSSTFTVGDQTVEAHAGQIVIAPANVPHKFVNTGGVQLKQIDIHVSKDIITEWLE